MNIFQIIIISVVGYLVGSISIARLVTRIVRPDLKLDSVQVADKMTGGTTTLNTVGATTASMLLGPRVGGMIGILDILKGALPTLIVRFLYPDQKFFLIMGIAILIGHIWPLYHKFRGGGGLSPALGALLVLDPLGTLICVLLAFLIGMFLLKEISFIVLGGPVLFIIWTAIFSRNWFNIIFALILNLILVVAVLPDVSRHLKAVKAGKTDLSDSMDTIPMGQMMKKMMIRMGLEKEVKNEDEPKKPSE